MANEAEKTDASGVKYRTARGLASGYFFAGSSGGFVSDCCGLRGFSAPRAESRAFARLNLRILSLLPAFTSYKKCILFRKHDGERGQQVEQATDLSHILSVYNNNLRPKVRSRNDSSAQISPKISGHTPQDRHHLLAEHNLTICTETTCFGRSRSF